MKQDEIIEMAKQAHRKLVTEVYVGHMGQLDPWTIELLKIFAKLVAAKVEAHYMQLFLDPENQPTQFGTVTKEYRDKELFDLKNRLEIAKKVWHEDQQRINKIAAKEREACAKECEQTALRMGSEWMAQHCANSIRARGEA